VTWSIYGPSQPRHTLVWERIPATSAPTVQTAKRCHVWLFGRLKPLVETLKQACLETPRVVWPTPGSLFEPRKPQESVTRDLQTIARRSGSHGDSL